MLTRCLDERRSTLISCQVSKIYNLFLPLIKGVTLDKSPKSRSSSEMMRTALNDVSSSEILTYDLDLPKVFSINALYKIKFKLCGL